MSGYKRVNFYELCRLCATNQQKDKTHIFQEEGRKIQLQNKIQSCLSLTVCENDFLPKVVCSKCLRTLEVCYTFRQECVTSESMLSSYFKNFRYTEDFKKSGKVYIKDTATSFTNSKSPNQYHLEESAPSTTNTSQQIDHLPFYTVQLPILTNQLENAIGTSVTTTKPIKNEKMVMNHYNLTAVKNVTQKIDSSSTSGGGSHPPPALTSQAPPSLSNVVVNANGEVLNIAHLVDFDALINLNQPKIKVGTPAVTSQNVTKLLAPPTLAPPQTQSHVTRKLTKDESSSPIIKIDFESKKTKFTSYSTTTVKMEDSSNKVIFNNQQEYQHNFTNFSNFSSSNSVGNGETSTVNLNVLNSTVGTTSTTVNHNNNNNNNNSNKASTSDESITSSQPQSSTVKCHLCEICQKSFKRREHLYQHVKLHTGFRPYTCENCNKSFMRKEHLLRHMTSHSGQKNFTCNVCDKSFSRNDNLLKHKKTHDKQASYTCDICQKQFVMKHYYLAHKMTHESDRCQAAIAAANVWNVLKT